MEERDRKELQRDMERIERKWIAGRFQRKPAGKAFPDAPDLIERGICPTCKKEIGKFRDALSKKEYEISGMCQECQDKVFGS